MTRTMQAARLNGRRDVCVVEVPVPEPGPGEVVIRVDAALTCGTDAKVFRRGYHARMLTPPCLFGHEYAGVVAAVGRGVTAVREGDAVVGANSAPCGECGPCSAGRKALCDDLLFVNGAFAEFMLLPARLVETNLYFRPVGLAPVHAASTEPVACVLKGIDTMDTCPGESVLLLGSGPIALIFAVALSNLGVETTVFARRRSVGPVAAAMGATRTVVGPSAPEARDALLAESPGGGGFDAVVEAAGHPETSQSAVDFCRRGGRVLLFGGCAADATVTWSAARLHYDEIAILSSFHHTPIYVEAALDALSDGLIAVGPVLETPVGLDGVAPALAAMCERTIRGKVPVIPGA